MTFARILGLVTEAYGGRGGIAQASRDLVGALAAAEDVEQIQLLPRHAPDPPGVLPPKVGQAKARPGKVAYSVAAFRAAAVRPDLLFCNHLYMAPLAAAVASARQAARSPSSTPPSRPVLSS